MSTTAQRTTDTLNVGDAASESAHGYTTGSAAGNVGQATATYEGNDGTPLPVTVTGRTTQSAVSFNMAVDPTNTGVTLTRAGDQNNGYQQAAVIVNGQAAGTWLEAFGDPFHRLLDDSFQIPPALTAGQSSLAITITPAAGTPAWSAARCRPSRTTTASSLSPWTA